MKLKNKISSPQEIVEYFQAFDAGYEFGSKDAERRSDWEGLQTPNREGFIHGYNRAWDRKLGINQPNLGFTWK